MKKIFNGSDANIRFEDLKNGRLKREKRFVKHHEAVEAVPEEGHWETVAEYPNGGKDVEWVVDVPGTEAREAWDEYEDIYRYVEHTADEISNLNKKSVTARLAAVETKIEALIEMLNDIRKEGNSDA